MRVLVVDQVDSYRETLAGHLSREGHDVGQAASAAEARRLVAEREHEIAVVDNEIEGGSGEALVEDLAGRFPSMKFVLVVNPPFDPASPDLFVEVPRRALWIPGPVPPAAIGNAVERVFDGQDVDRESPRRAPSSSAGRSSSGITRDPGRQLMEVRRSYQEKIPVELEMLERMLERFRDEGGGSCALEEAHKIAHTLHGTAGTLGFPEVSESAARIEMQLKPLVSGKAESRVDWEEVFGALEKAKSAPERPSLLIEVPAHDLPEMSDIGTVLVVDEDRGVLAEAEAIGREKLINVFTASNPLLALEILKEQRTRIDGAIIDTGLGDGGDAFDLAAGMRSLDEMSELPVAFMSSDLSVTNRVAAAHAGASQFLQKPLEGHEVVEAVRLFVAAKRVANTSVLVVDDDPHFCDHTAAILEAEGMEVTILCDPGRVMDVLRSSNPDLLLLDVGMPGVSGHDVCRMLRGTAAWQDLPILFLTARSDAESRLECFRAGGDDYIEKPVIREELLARINVRKERIRLYQARAERDALTDLPNRRAFLDMFAIRAAEGERYSRPVSLCVIDLDHFKSINDRYGHLSGDRVLLGLGKLLSARFRAVDARARWGGEEFVVAFYGEEASTSRQILKRVLEEFCRMEFEGDHGETFGVTFSAGIASIPADGESFEEIFRVADSRLYQAKENGRNRIEI